MTSIYESTHFVKALKKLLKKRPETENKIKGKIQLLQKDKDDPVLHLHKLTGIHKDKWSISVESDLRVVFMYLPDGIILINIGKHEEVY